MQFIVNRELFVSFSKWGSKRGSYMSAHVFLNLLNELRKRDKIMNDLPLTEVCIYNSLAP